MNYYKNVKEGFIQCIGTTSGELLQDVCIDENEYSNIMSIIQSKPTSLEGKDYRLKTDLTWEEFDLPIVESVETQPSPEYLKGYDQALVDLLGGEQ